MKTVPCTCDDCGAAGEMKENRELLNGWERQGWYVPCGITYMRTRCPKCHEEWIKKGPPPRVDPYKPINIG